MCVGVCVCVRSCSATFAASPTVEALSLAFGWNIENTIQEDFVLDWRNALAWFYGEHSRSLGHSGQASLHRGDLRV